MSLHVGVIRVEQFLHAIYCQLLDLIYELTATVIALARQSLGVLVGERRPHRFEHRLRHEVLAGDQLETVSLTIDFAVDQPRNLGITLGEMTFRHRTARDTSFGRCLGLRSHGFSESIFWMRRSCRPPSNLVSSHFFIVFTASSSLMKRAGSTRTLELLCCRESAPISGSQASAARTPGYRFATMSIPTPLPQRRIPRLASPVETSRATGWPKSG